MKTAVKLTPGQISLLRNEAKKGIPVFTFIDLFAGIGGIRIPFEELGGECVFTSEWDYPCQVVYEANFGEVPYGDITKLKPEKIAPFDILLAGFPCQPFSQAGLKKGLNDTRGTLFFNILKILEYHQPKVVLLENVKRLASHDGGNTLKVILNSLNNLHYQTYYTVLNAKDFGVPQNRERLFIVGFLGKADFNFPTPPELKTRLGDILEKNPDPKYTISDKLWAGHKRRKEENKLKGNGFGYSLFNESSEHTNTMSARYYKDGSEILIKQLDKNPRKLTPREAARLQGFPENFKISTSNTQAYKQFGNSVSVPVIRAVAESILKAMKNQKISDTSKRKIDLREILDEHGYSDVPIQL